MFFFPPTQAPEHETTGGGEKGGEIYEELAYNRKNSLRTQPQKNTTRPNSSLATRRPASASLR